MAKSLVGFLSFCVAGTSVFADEIVTKDGHRTVGVIVHVDNFWTRIVCLDGRQNNIAKAFIAETNRDSLRPPEMKMLLDAIRENAKKDAQKEIDDLRNDVARLKRELASAKSTLSKYISKDISKARSRSESRRTYSDLKDIDRARNACGACKGTGKSDCIFCVDGNKEDVDGDIVDCEACNGRGWKTCTFCDGSGKR